MITTPHVFGAPDPEMSEKPAVTYQPPGQLWKRFPAYPSLLSKWVIQLRPRAPWVYDSINLFRIS